MTTFPRILVGRHEYLKMEPWQQRFCVPTCGCEPLPAGSLLEKVVCSRGHAIPSLERMLRS